MIIHFLASVSETHHCYNNVCLFLWKGHSYGFLLDWSIECRVVNNRLTTRVLGIRLPYWDGGVCSYGWYMYNVCVNRVPKILTDN
jgi:hypothetical protein